MPFNTDVDRADHWKRHHADFEPPPCSEAEYEQKAETFLNGPIAAGALQCVRLLAPGRTRRCRYDPATNEYAVLAIEDGCLVTYFKPDPLKHRQATNEAYFHANC